MSAPDGLIGLKAAQPAILQRFNVENDPVARARTRYRLVWQAVRENPNLAVRIGGRMYVVNKDSHIRALAAALGITEAAPKRRTPKVSALSTNAAAAA
jgi:hypothetical protein